MKKSILLINLFTFLSYVSLAQVTIKGVTLPQKIEPSKTTLILNGGGVRIGHMIKVYVAGLYLQDKTNIPKDIIEADKPMCVRIYITSTILNSENMVRAIRAGFDKSTSNKSDQFTKEINIACSIFQSSEVKVGDMFEIYYVPGTGIHANKNGKDLNINIMGLNFKKAMFGIWLGENPVDYYLKEKMLGL